MFEVFRDAAIEQTVLRSGLHHRLPEQAPATVGLFQRLPRFEKKKIPQKMKLGD